MSEFNDWFCSLPEGRQAILRDDKWRLADFAFQAGFKQAQAEINALKAENKRLQEKCEHSTIARFNWRNKYLTLIGSVIAILGLDDLTARDDVVLAVEALKAKNAELLAALTESLAYVEATLSNHDAGCQRHPSTEHARDCILSDLDQIKTAIAKARGDL